MVVVVVVVVVIRVAVVLCTCHYRSSFCVALDIVAAVL